MKDNQQYAELLRLREYTLLAYTQCAQGVWQIGSMLFGMIRAEHPDALQTLQNDIDIDGTVRKVSGDEEIYVALKHLLRLKNDLEQLVIHAQQAYRAVAEQLGVHAPAAPIQKPDTEITDLDGLALYAEQISEQFDIALQHAEPLLTSNMKDERLTQAVSRRFSDVCRTLNDLERIQQHRSRHPGRKRR